MSFDMAGTTKVTTVPALARLFQEELKIKTDELDFDPLTDANFEKLLAMQWDQVSVATLDGQQVTRGTNQASSIETQDRERVA